MFYYRAILSSVLLALICITPLFAQFAPVPGETITTYEYEATDITGLEAMLAEVGSGVDYDLNQFTFASEAEVFSVDYVAFSTDLLCSDHPAFQDANLAYTIETEEGLGTFYGQLTSTDLLNLGICGTGDIDGDGMDDVFVTYFDPPIPGPLTFPAVGTTRTQSWDTIFEFEGQPPFNSGTTTETISTVGEGTLFFPGGASEPYVREDIILEITIPGLPTPTTSQLINLNTNPLGSALSKAFRAVGYTANVTLDQAGVPNGLSYSIVSNEGAVDPTAVEPIGEGIPAGFDLGQNYPNPFNPSTQIPFELAEPGHVKIDVFDVNGRLVDTLVDQTMAAGSYRTDWQPEGLPSGVYMYQLQAGGTTKMKTMIFQK